MTGGRPPGGQSHACLCLQREASKSEEIRVMRARWDVGDSGVSDLRVPSPAASRILARSSRSVSRRSVNSESTRAIVFVTAAAKDGNIVTIHFDCKVLGFLRRKK